MATRTMYATGTGGEAFIVLPNGSERPYSYELHSVHIKYTSVGPPAGARQVRLTIEDPQGRVLAITGGDTHPTNQTRHYMAYPDAPLDRVPNGDDIQWMPLPPVCVIIPGCIIRAKNVAQATPNDTVQMSLQYDTSLGSRGA